LAHEGGKVGSPTKRLDDSVGNIFRWGIHDSITKGKVEEAVNMLYGMLKKVGREMVTKTRKYIEGMTSNVKGRRERLS
jgi:hypothetical protein